MAVAQTTETKLHLDMPDFSDNGQVECFCALLIEHRDVLGVKGLQKLVPLYMKHQSIGHSQLDRIKAKVARINGERSQLQRQGDNTKSLRRTATRFFESLSTSGLRQQSRLYQVDYDAYDSQEDIIQTLTERYLEMQG